MSSVVTLPLADVCDFRRGLTYKKSDEVEFSRNVVLRANNINLSDHTLNFDDLRCIQTAIPDEKKVKGGSLLICTASGSKSHLGKVAYIDSDLDYGFGGFMAMITPRRDLDPKYLFFLMTSPDFKGHLGKVTDGANINNLKFSDIKDFPVPVPPLPEQRRIVGILDQAFEGIAKAKANAERNLANAKELFESELNAIFEDHPADWNVSPLRDVCKFVGGSQPPKSTFVYESKKGYVRLLQIRDYKSDAKAVYIPKELARRHCEDHDIMIGRYGPPLFQIMRGKSGAYNVALMKALPHTEILSRDFLFYFLRNRNILEYIEATADRTAGQTGFNKERLEAYTIPYPSTDKQFGVVERLHNAEAHSASLAASYVQKSNTLDSLKTSLLHEAFSGKL